MSIYRVRISNSSEQEIYDAISNTHRDGLYITLIHFPIKFDEIPEITHTLQNEIESWRKNKGAICKTEKLAIFGPLENPIWALKVQGSSGLLHNLRLMAEGKFDRMAIEHSRTWPFNPHITLLKTQSPLILTKEFPEWIQIESCEWIR